MLDNIPDVVNRMQGPRMDIPGRILKQRAEGGLQSIPSLRWLIIVTLLLGGCATSYKPKVTGPLPFAFTPTEEQCAQLLKERRTYRATEKTATYVSTATALLSVVFLGLVEEKAAPAASAGATLLASGVSVFYGEMARGLEEEIDLGSCLNRPPPPLPTLTGGGTTVPDLPPPPPDGMLSESKAFNRQGTRR